MLHIRFAGKRVWRSREFVAIIRGSVASSCMEKAWLFSCLRAVQQACGRSSGGATESDLYSRSMVKGFSLRLSQARNAWLG